MSVAQALAAAKRAGYEEGITEVLHQWLRNLPLPEGITARVTIEAMMARYDARPTYDTHGRRTFPTGS